MMIKLTIKPLCKLLSLFSALLVLTSCTGEYTIAGNSSVSDLDGRMLYLRAQRETHGNVASFVRVEQTRCIDSCKVVHGRFNFVGDVDSVMVAMLYSDNNYVMPVVIENGNLSVQVDNIGQRVTGSPLNDRLYKFIEKRNRLDNELWEVQQKCIRMMREGATPEEIEKHVAKKVEKLNKRSTQLETEFVMENYDNVLGSGYFMLLCSQYPTPIMTEQIAKIVKEAPEPFLNNPFVNNYVRVAKARSSATQED